jgi:hypothetical protein
MTTRTHFTVIELELPKSNSGYGTPLSGDDTQQGFNVYRFTDYSGIISERPFELLSGQKSVNGIKKCVTKISENTTTLQPQAGLPIRANGSISFATTQGDPNPFAPEVDATVKDNGDYFSKLDARNIIVNTKLKIYDCSIEGGVTFTREYLTNGLSTDGKGKWTLKFKDQLSTVDIGETMFPPEDFGFLRFSIDDTTTTLQVDSGTNYAVDDVIRIGEELMKITAVSGIGTGSAEITVQTRGNDIAFTNTLSKTIKDSHSAGDEIFVCYVSDNEHIADLLSSIVTNSGIPSSYINITEWKSELDDWLAGVRVNTIFYESLDSNEALLKVLDPYMISMWLDPQENKVKILTVNVWKESDVSISEGSEIDYRSIKKSNDEKLRVTRSLVTYDKLFLASTESLENYKKASLFVKPELEGVTGFNQQKIKNHGLNYVIDKGAADLFVNRYTNRFANPKKYSWTTQEVKLNFSVGDVVTINSENDVGFDGLPSLSRAQITSIQPKYTNFGREYMVQALTYEPNLQSGSEIVITGDVANINLFTQYAGAPAGPVTITFIFDGVRSSSNSTTNPSVRAGNFASGSVINIIMINGTELMSKGGDGGNANQLDFDPEIGRWLQVLKASNGGNGGTVYEADGVTTNIYFSGSTPSATYPNADGYIIAPSGGDGGNEFVIIDENDPAGIDYSGKNGDGGDGGDGFSPGKGGERGEAYSNTNAFFGQKGKNGTSDRLSGSFGQYGADGNESTDGGLPGKAISKSGASVILFGANSARYIKGIGD